MKAKQIEHTNNEQSMLVAVQHPFIINLWGVFQDNTNLYMVMDFVPGGELFTLLRRSNVRLRPPLVLVDLTPPPAIPRSRRQVLCSRSGTRPESPAQLGHHIPRPQARKYPSQQRRTRQGRRFRIRKTVPEHHLDAMWYSGLPCTRGESPAHCLSAPLTPLQIIGQHRYNKSVDWYALGVLIFEMLSGLPPYHQPEANPVLLYEKITRGPTFIRWPAFNEHATDLILKLMEGDPSKRYGNLQHGAGDVFAHPWFREVDWDRLANREITAPYLPKIAGDGDASAYVYLSILLITRAPP